MSIDPRFGRLTYEIIGVCMDVHRSIGPGLLESVYERCVAHLLELRGLEFRRQVPAPLDFRGMRIERAYVADFVVEDAVVLELKAVEALTAVHRAQVRTYLRLLRLDAGLLINFNVSTLRDRGICRMSPPTLRSSHST